MDGRLTLEVIAKSVEDAVEAQRGGAHRLEVVRDLARDGLTPPIELVRRIQREVDLPLRVMVRESDGFACPSDDERRMLVDAASAFDALGVDGLVVGWTRRGRIDEETLGRVLQAGPSLRATFHHAFDALPDPEAALGVLKRHSQIDRVLTRGGTADWSSRCATLTRYAGWAGPLIRVLPGGGVDADALRALAACGSVAEAHIGRAARIGRAIDGPVSAEAVAALRRAADDRTGGLLV
jgi:copper homeostasis protein